jgi:hypothetical protein
MRAQVVLQIAFISAVLGGAGCASAVRPEDRPADAAARRTSQRVEVLNRLRNEVNVAYGFRDGAPRVNLGPCGRFARDFRERWNARFADKVTIAFVMAAGGSQCHHVLVRLPDGTYYDGGNGIVTGRALMTLYPNSRIDEMTVFDPELLDRRSYGLKRSYPECPNYSDALTAKLIDSHLAMLPPEARKEKAEG